MRRFELLPRNRFLTDLLYEVCVTNPQICNDVIDLICGPSENQRNNVSKLNEVMSMFENDWCCYSISDHSTRVRVSRSERLEFSTGKLPDFHCSRFCLISFVGFLQVLHYGQEIRFGFFGKYKIGLRRPPDFPLSRITAPISLHYSTADKLADATDVEILIPKLNSVIFIQRIDDKFNHIDFVWSMYSASLIYSKILDIFQRYQ